MGVFAALKGATGGVLVGSLAAMEGPALGWLGFTALGPAAGSWAAATMSNIALGNGVGVVAGSMYAAAQSAAMGGGAILGAPFVVVCVVGGAVTLWACERNGSGGGDDKGASGEDKRTSGEGVDASATDLDEDTKGEERSEENETEGDQQSDE